MSKAAAPKLAIARGAAPRETAGPLRGLERLRQEGFCFWSASRADPTRANAQIVVPAHDARRKVAKDKKGQEHREIGKVRRTFAMFEARLKFLPFPNQPTGRTLRLLSCPPRSLVPRAQLPTQEPLGTRGDLRQNAVRVMRWILR